MKKLRIPVFVAAVVFALIFLAGWNLVTNPPGEMFVNYQSPKQECFEMPEYQFKYCFHSQPNSNQEKILYVFHGRNLDEKTWDDRSYYTGMIQRQWEDLKIIPPKVVTISFGPVWLLTPKGNNSSSGLLETFVEKILPQIEEKIGTPKERFLLGESMGGLNSLILSLRNPGLFSRVAALCPPIYKTSPFSAFSDIWGMIKLTGAEPRTILGIIALAKKYISSEQEWSNIDPLHLVEQISLEKSPKFYLSAGLYDKYGLYAGVLEFIDRARQKSLSVEWKPLYGGHCAIDIDSTAQFFR